jgi:hypothetical protein
MGITIPTAISYEACVLTGSCNLIVNEAGHFLTLIWEHEHTPCFPTFAPLKAKANDLPIVISYGLVGGNAHKRFTPCTCTGCEP